MSTLTPIRYIGKRPTYIDGLYGTRTAFVQGETVMVDSAIAEKMLRHGDQYELGKAKGAAPAVEKPSDKPAKEEEATQDLRDQIAIMGKDELKELAWTRYQLKFPGNPSVETLRTRVTHLVDQFGAI